MKKINSLITVITVLFSISTFQVMGQLKQDSSAYYDHVNTYLNPVLPGDHPDPTVLKTGNDFYLCGSSFHFNPYLPIYHSKDLVHWEIISRVVFPERAGFVTDKPSEGIWQGAITYFYGSYWIYFSANGQWFSKAQSPKGPWTTPVQLTTNPKTGSLGNDNSIFVDDDGKPYIVIKNGKTVNRLQALGKDGQLTDSVINLDWINAKMQYSWAEGPVMSKRNGYYYYFPAGDVTGGQYVLRTKTITSDSTKWERLGNFFKPITDASARFRRPNHISAPLQLADGSWWTVAQSYEIDGKDDWYGTGRQTSLFPITWEGDRPWGMAPSSAPIKSPGLPRSGILWRSVNSDYFTSGTLGLWWHFLNRKATANYSLQERNGWLRLKPSEERAHILQKETDHFYTAVTKVDLNAMKAGDKAGIYLTNGNQQVFVQLYTGFDRNKKIVFKMDTAVRMIANTFGNLVWLKVQRKAHMLTAYASANGKTWTSLGAPISAVNLDKVQPNYNSWVGTSVGLFAEGKTADFDFFIGKDGFTELPAQGFSNQFGIVTLLKDGQKVVTNTSLKGGWFMISGVDLGDKDHPAQIEIVAASSTDNQLEIWLDDLGSGRKIATVSITKMQGKSWKTFTSKLTGTSGHHDVFVKFKAGSKQSTLVKSIRFNK
ncbi:family 43 glycosylhydrolase [Pedobacter duraquae]|nr:family 43 glycosylhydrolase [Pedobacter duraquae]